MVENRKFGSVRRLPSGRFQAQLQVDGLHEQAPQTFPTRQHAEEWLILEARARSRGEGLDHTGGREVFGSYAIRWLEQRRDLAPRTRETYRSELQHSIRRFGDTRISSIRASAVRGWRSTLLDSLHPNTTAKAYRRLHQVMQTAVDDGLIGQNPCRIRGAARERLDERPLPTIEGIEKIVAAIDARYAAMVEIAAFGGLRFGEIVALRRRDFDIETSTVHVSRSLSQVACEGIVFGPPKSRAGVRSVCLPTRSAVAVTDHIESFTSPDPESLIFTTATAGPVENQRFRKPWQAALDDTGLGDDLRFHDLRHFAGTLAAQVAKSPKDIMQRLGHSSVTTTMHYVKAVEGNDRAIASDIDRFIEGRGGVGP